MFWNTEVAFKYKMSSMQAALGLAQLERIDELVSRKREIADAYLRELEGEAGLVLNSEAPGVLNTFWMVTVILDPAWRVGKLALMERMREKGVDCRPFFHPLSSLPAYASLPHARRCQDENAVSYAISPWGLNLPSGFDMTPERVAYVCERLRESVSELRTGA
jgi:perosamine synthetase